MGQENKTEPSKDELQSHTAKDMDTGKGNELTTIINLPQGIKE